jgi:hypothetical protein
MTNFKLLGAAAILLALIATPVLAQSVQATRRGVAQARSNGRSVLPQAYGREVAAPPWSAACMTDHGPSECGELMWIYGSRGAFEAKGSAF